MAASDQMSSFRRVFPEIAFGSTFGVLSKLIRFLFEGNEVRVGLEAGKWGKDAFWALINRSPTDTGYNNGYGVQ